MTTTEHRCKISVGGCDKCDSVTRSVFGVLNKTELETLSQHKTYSTYKKGQVIFYEGNQPHGFYCIHSGKVKIHKLGNDGKEQIVRLAKKSSAMGYRSMLGDEPYNATATAIEDTVACFFPKNIFISLLSENNKLALHMIKHLSADLKIAEQMVINMAQKHARERVSETLLYLKDFFGFDTDNQTINTILTREDIGSLSGTTTETTIRILSEFNKSGLIELQGKKIKLKDIKTLKQIANIGD